MGTELKSISIVDVVQRANVLYASMVWYGMVCIEEE